MWSIIATWEMAFEGLKSAQELLAAGGSAADAVETNIRAVEDNPAFSSVGFGGLPNEAGQVELDAAFMNGDTFQLGAVAGIQDVANPITVARSLSLEKFNSFLVGQGATEFAQQNGFAQKAMLTETAKAAWQKRVQEVQDKKLTAYDGHDTVGVLALDQAGSMAAGTSTSGLFMKKPGRVGDSPLVGSGLYVDSEIGGAAATGLGEDIMKGVLSYEITRLMDDHLPIQAACDQAVFALEKRLKSRYGKAGAMSVVALDKFGNWGVATTVEFPFCVATSQAPATVYVARPQQDHTVIEKMK